MNTDDPSSLLPAGYGIIREEFRVDSLIVEMFLVEDPNQLAMSVAADVFAADERFPYWAELWPSARALSRFVAARGRLDGTTVVELGCGMGLVGVTAALCGAAGVVFTDFEPDALAFAAANHALNIGAAGVTRLVDWRRPPDDLSADLVLAADVLYERRFIQPLRNTLTQLMAPGGTALVAEPDRGVAVDAMEELDRSGFSRELHLEEVSVGSATYPVWIHELRMR